MARRRTRKKLPTEPISTTIIALSHEGRGIAEIDGKKTFISGALPGEAIEFTLTKRHGRFDEGQVSKVITPSPHRVTPACEHANICGGCSLQHLAHAEQIAHKQKVLAELLEHQANITPKNWALPITSKQTQYRHKARLGVRYVHKKESVLVGFREKSSNYITETNHCPVLIKEVGDKINTIKELISSLTAYNTIPQIEVAASEGETALILRHLKPLIEDTHNLTQPQNSIQDTHKLQNFAKANNFQIYLQPKGPDSIHKLWPNDNIERLKYSLPEFNLTLQFHPADFTQVNPEINQKMITQAIRWLEPTANETILDLFCGIGNFTLPIATTGAAVTGIEGSITAIERANENKALNHANWPTLKTQFHVHDLTQPFTDQTWANQKYTSILLDPPRSGAQEVVENINHFSPQKIIYISCNPATFARDAAILKQNGYNLEKVGIMDMFPHTAHVETIGLFLKTPK